MFVETDVVSCLTAKWVDPTRKMVTGKIAPRPILGGHGATVFFVLLLSLQRMTERLRGTRLHKSLLWVPSSEAICQHKLCPPQFCGHVLSQKIYSTPSRKDQPTHMIAYAMGAKLTRSFILDRDHLTKKP